MSFALKASETVEQGIQRLLVKELTRARDCLKPKHTSEVKSIHEARKSLKKARAVVRLVRSELGEAEYARLNAIARDVARTVSPARDAQVLSTTLESLLHHFHDQIATGAFRKARAAARRFGEESVAAVTENRAALRDADHALTELIDDAEKLPLSHSGWKALAPNLERIYRQGRRAFQSAYSAPSDVAFHEWRKGTKYLRHQIDVLSPSWPKPLEELSDQLHELSDLLGEDHDLVMLRELVRRDPERFGPAATVRALFALIERRQEQLRQEARPLGERLYVEKPRAFTRRLQGYWQSWHLPPPKPQPLPDLLSA